ncbi:MAG: type II toxin-antitoxin system RelE/ParE family toxin [Candidatus Aminicenantes bacterium]|nr:type II toxin-antitoxin system RelE/ParE family toxin [Candidatus Aminicenantes bacterium]
MKWIVDFYETKSGNCPVRKYLLSLRPKSRNKILEAMEYLETFGLDLKEPYVKFLGDKIFELRAKDHEGIYRVLYFAASGRRFIMLNGFTKKTQKTPRKEIEIALKRKKEFSNE